MLNYFSDAEVQLGESALDSVRSLEARLQRERDELEQQLVEMEEFTSEETVPQVYQFINFKETKQQKDQK